MSRVEEITGVPADKITEAARMYATSGPSIIPWTPITDQQRNSTSAIRLMCTLRAVCGYLDVRGGEVLHGFHADIITETELEMHEALPAGQRVKQLGYDDHPVFTYRAADKLADASQRVWGHPIPNIISGACMAVPSNVFRAMADSDPYPVRAFFSLGNNTLLSYANMQLIHRALMSQELIVAFEHFKTPTAQLADYILPGDGWLERDSISDSFGWTAIMRTSQKSVEPPEECRSTYDFWRELAVRMGFEEHFPWTDNEAVLDYRVSKLAPSFAEFAQSTGLHMDKLKFKKYETTGFATPSGKVELYSSILDEFGFDPLPYWRENPATTSDWPLILFMGVREDEYFQTGHRHIKSLRKRKPEPLAYLSRQDAKTYGYAAGDTVLVETQQGAVQLTVSIREEMPEGVVRVPHGWWLPERAEGDGTLSGAWIHADAQICPDDPDYLDLEQGIPHFKGIACRLRRPAA